MSFAYGGSTCNDFILSGDPPVGTKENFFQKIAIQHQCPTNIIVNVNIVSSYCKFYGDRERPGGKKNKNKKKTENKDKTNQLLVALTTLYPCCSSSLRLKCVAIFNIRTCNKQKKSIGHLDRDSMSSESGVSVQSLYPLYYSYYPTNFEETRLSTKHRDSN